MNRDLEIKLMDCLDALADGSTLEEILARYPQDAAALRPHLQTTLAVCKLADSVHPAAQSRSKAAFLAAAQDIPNRGWSFRRLSALGALAILLMVLGLVALLFITAESALPGSALYGLKLAGEDIRLRLAPDNITRDGLRTQFEQGRLNEVRDLLAAGLDERVTFRGEVESIEPERWIVSGITVVIDQNTIISGPRVPGVEARVTGQTSREGVQALEIVIETPDPSIIPPAPVQTREAPITPATATPTPTPSPTPRPTATPTLAVAAPTTPLTLQPPSDNDNDDEEDDGDQDSEEGDEDHSDTSGD